ncbi:MAG TPA: sigma-70 family RNA polymerase sigma factor [Gemmataceae bacterium]|jgi:RNA polymerase sigma factor (sigma-70 family)
MSRSAWAASVRQLRGTIAAQRHHDESDEQLLHAFLVRHEETAFTALVRRHGPMVMGVCRRVLGHVQDAEDVFQATFLVLARRAAAVRDKAALASFLHGTAYRLALRAKRTAARRRQHERQAPTRSTDDPSDKLLWREVRTLLDEEIGRLPDIYRSVFVLCCLENLSRAEAARRLGIKEVTVWSRLAGARKRLQRQLSRRGVELMALLTATALATQTASAFPAALLAKTTAAALMVNSSPPLLSIGKAKLMAVLLLVGGLASAASLWACRGFPTSAVPPSQLNAQEEKDRSVPRTSQEQKKQTIEIRGRVLGPDGEPVKGARLYSARLRRMFPHDDAVVARAQTDPTDAKGRFRLRVNKPGEDEYAYLLAHAAGFGVDWINLGEDDLSSEVTLRLVKDVPITGRVVNTEGRPVAGVSVSVARIFVPANEKLDDYLSGWHGGQMKFFDSLSSVRKRLYAPLDAVSGAATTDKDGRFTLHGAGGERIVHVAFSGGGVARTTPYVIARSGFDAKPYNAALQKDEDGRKFVEWNRFHLYPSDFTFVAEAGKTIEGTIKDAASGKPLPGCRVVITTSYAHGTTAVSDAEGKYRLEGIAKSRRGYDVGVRPPKHSTYLYGEGRRVADTPGFTKVRLDFELVKGAIVTGRAVDKQTGKGVRCYFRSVPLPDNKFIGSKPGFDLRDGDMSREIEAGEDGHFRLVTIPGKALLAAGVREEKRFHGERLNLYRQAGPDPAHKDIFKEHDDTWIVRTAPNNRFEILSLYNAVKVIDVKENGETRVELSVDRGATARIAVQDAGGKPLAGAWTAGLTDCWPITYKLPEATATVYALNPDKPRMMAFFHAEKKLGGTAVVRGEEKEPLVVKLRPVGTVSGRLLDGDGNPLEGVEVSIVAQTDIGRELYRFAPTGNLSVTDTEGRFRLEGVVPDLKFTLNLRRGRTFFVGERSIGARQLKPGEILDLGDVRTKQRN